MKPVNVSKKTELDNALTGQVMRMSETGFPVAVDPDAAEMMGAFEETAVDNETAFESRFDHLS